MNDLKVFSRDIDNNKIPLVIPTPATVVVMMPELKSYKLPQGICRVHYAIKDGQLTRVLAVRHWDLKYKGVCDRTDLAFLFEACPEVRSAILEGRKDYDSDHFVDLVEKCK